MAWRLAKSLIQLREQINAIYQNRSNASDGSIGDEAHSSRASDHNPNDAGVVCAIDITNDPAHGLRSRQVANALAASHDDRIKYLISDGEICSGTDQGKPAWKWRKYTGTNPHNHHFHISVKPQKKFYDDQAPWQLDGVPVPIEPVDATPPEVDATPLLVEGSKGNAVATIQRLLNEHGASIREDAEFGPATKKAVIAFQKKSKLVADGKVGTYTWAALRKGT